MSLYITGLYDYPLKSARGRSLQQARLTPYGLEYDRHWMIVDRKGRFLSQRRFPRMALIDAQPLAADELRLQAPAMGSLSVKLQKKQALPIRIWGFEHIACDAGADAAAWCSEFLDLDCRLAGVDSHFRRPVDSEYDDWHSQVRFADGFPFLLLSEASLEGLNRRLKEPVPMDRFRPNIVIGGVQRPHEEDHWRSLRIGADLIFHIVKPCSRCTIPTVNQATGERGVEPTATLATYRSDAEGDVYFGQNVIHETKTGILRLGDPVEVLSSD